MAANDFQYGSVPLPGDIACKNTDVVAIKSGDQVKLDTVNVLSGTQGAFGVLQGTGAATPMIGVAMEAIPVGRTGRIRPLGAIVPVVASAAIAAGVEVTGAANGQVAAAGAAARQLGISLTAAAAINDTLLILLCGAKNA